MDECNMEESIFDRTVSSISILSLFLMGQLAQLGFQSPFSCLYYGFQHLTLVLLLVF